MARSEENQETKRSRSGSDRNKKEDKGAMKAKDMDLLLQKAFGGDPEAQDEIRNQFINLNEFLDEAVPVLTRMAVNDNTLKIEGDYMLS